MVYPKSCYQKVAEPGLKSRFLTDYNEGLRGEESRETRGKVNDRLNLRARNRHS